MTFAKLFDTPDGQLLVTKEFNDDEEGAFRVSMRGEACGGADPAMTFGWPTEAERDLAFDSVTQENADKTAAELAGVVRSFMGKVPSND